MSASMSFRSVIGIGIFLFFTSLSWSQTATWIGATGNWDVPSNWSPTGIPGTGHTVVISGASSDVTIPAAYTAMCKAVRVLSGAKLRIQTTGALQSNGSTDDGVRVTDANSEILNSGTILIGNTSSVAWRGLYMATGGKLTNHADALVEINGCNNQGVLMVGSNTNLDNSGIIRIGNLSSIAWEGIDINSAAKIRNHASGTIELDRINADGLKCFGAGTKITNDGKLFMGKLASINYTCIRINDQAEIENSATGQMEINNTNLYHGIDMWGVNTLFNNYGSIKIGNSSAIAWNGFYLSDNCIFNNHAGATIEINRSGNGFEFRINARFNNYGDLIIGNLAAITNVGITMYQSPKLENFSSGRIEVNNVNNFDAIIVQNSGTEFINAGSLKVGNLSSVKGSGMVLLTSADFTNASGGTIEINNTVNWDGLALYDAGTTFTNEGSLKIGNLFSVKRTAINMGTMAEFVNSAAGVIELDNTTSEDGITLNGSGTKFSNFGNLKVGKSTKVQRDGIGVYSQGQFINMSTGMVEINKTRSRHGINLENASTQFTNSGILKIGSMDSIRLAGIKIVTGSKFVNNAGAHIEIDSTGDDAIQVFNSGSNFTNAGGIVIGSKYRINFWGVWLSSGSSFVNQTTGTIQMNRTDVGIFGSGTGTGFFNQGIIDIGHTAGIRSAGVFLSSSAYFENQSGSFLNIDQTGIGVAIANGIQLSGSASFSNAGILSLGITAPIKTHGIQLTNPSTFTNTSSGIVNIDRTLGLFAILPKSGTNFINQGQVNIGTIAQVNHGIGDDAGTGGTVTNTGTLTFDDILLDGIYSNQTIANNSGGAIAIPSGGKLRIASLGVLNCAAGSNTTNSGTMTNIGTINCAGSFDNQGIYSGTGIFNNSLFSNPSNGIVSPGLSPGCLQFTNGWTSIGALQVEINGVNPCVDFDQIQVTGNAQVGGTLHLNFGFAPSCGQTFQIVDADSYTGSFSGITTTPSNMVATYSNGLITVWDDQMAILNVQDGLYYCTIADALAASMTNDGDVIEIPAGTYNEPCLLIDKSVVLKPMGSVTIDCLKMDGTGKIMVLDGDLTTNTLNLTNGLIRTNGHNLKCGSITGGGPGSYVVTD